MEEALVGRDAGLLTDVGDVAGMASALASLVDPDRRTALAAEAVDAVRPDFDLARQATVFATAYRQLLGLGVDGPGPAR